MIDRRTFLKLSAGALVLTAAGALTGCGTTMDLNHPQQEVEGVMFLCDVLSETDFSGGENTKIQYRPYFAIWNRTEEDVTIPWRNITGIFTENGGKSEKMEFIAGLLKADSLKVGAKQYQEFNRNTFGLETENRIPSSHENTTLPTRQNGTYEVRIKYKGKIVVFFYDGENMTSRLE